jgi:hypothetical protein
VSNFKISHSIEITKEELVNYVTESGNPKQQKIGLYSVEIEHNALLYLRTE